MWYSNGGGNGVGDVDNDDDVMVTVTVTVMATAAATSINNKGSERNGVSGHGDGGSGRNGGNGGRNFGGKGGSRCSTGSIVAATIAAEFPISAAATWTPWLKYIQREEIGRSILN